MLRISLTFALVALATTVLAAPIGPGVGEKIIEGAAQGLEQRLSGLSLETGASREIPASHPPTAPTFERLPEPHPDAATPSINHRTSAARRILQRLPKSKFTRPTSEVGKGAKEQARVGMARKAAKVMKAVQAEEDAAAGRGSVMHFEQGQGSGQGRPYSFGKQP